MRGTPRSTACWRRWTGSTPRQPTELLMARPNTLPRTGVRRKPARMKRAAAMTPRMSEKLFVSAVSATITTPSIARAIPRRPGDASGIPISVVDLDRASEPFKLALAPAGTRYVFNTSGQEIDVSGLLCLWDAGGPTANAVKDAMRTKTHDGTRRTLSVLWGVRGFEAQLAGATAWYRELLERAGATTASA